MKYCRLNPLTERGQLVLDCTERDPATSFHPVIAAEFIQCPDEVQNGWYRWSDGTFSPRAEPYWKTAMTRYEFLTLFTLEERTAIRGAAKTDPVIEDMLQLLGIANDIDIADPNTSGGLDYLAGKGLITAERCAEIKKGIYVEGDK